MTDVDERRRKAFEQIRVERDCSWRIRRRGAQIAAATVDKVLAASEGND